LIRTIAGVEGSFVSNTGTAGAISKVASTGYFYATTGITAPDDGGVLEWYISNAGVKSTFLSAVAIEPAPNQSDQAAGIRAALGLNTGANLDSQLSAISNKTTNLPALPAAVGDIPTTSQIWTHATRALTDKDNFNLANSQTFSTTGSVGSVTSVTNAVTVGTINNNVITANAIATDAITAAKIADNAIDAGSIASGAITNAKFAAGAISATVVADNTITDAKIASGAITNTKFAAGAVDATAIATDAIAATKIADNAIDGGAVATSAIEKIQANLATQASVNTKASQASVDTLNAKADDITALVL
jgi:hypothetical protein